VYNYAQGDKGIPGIVSDQSGPVTFHIQPQSYSYSSRPAQVQSAATGSCHIPTTESASARW